MKDQMCVIPLLTKTVDAAKDFVTFMTTPANYNKAFSGFSTSPVFKGETANITTPQYKDAKDSIESLTAASIAWPSVIGFTQVDAAKSIQDLMLGNKTVEQCAKAMDDDRIKNAKAQQAPGF